MTRYIEMLLGELTTMAKAAELKPLIHFLEATRSEAGLAMQRYGCNTDALEPRGA